MTAAVIKGAAVARGRRVANRLARMPRTTVRIELPRYSAERLAQIRLSVAACMAAELDAFGAVEHRDGLAAFRWCTQCEAISCGVREAIVTVGALEFLNQWSALVAVVDRIGVASMRGALARVMKRVKGV